MILVLFILVSFSTYGSEIIRLEYKARSTISKGSVLGFFLKKDTSFKDLKFHRENIYERVNNKLVKSPKKILRKNDVVILFLKTKCVDLVKARKFFKVNLQDSLVKDAIEKQSGKLDPAEYSFLVGTSVKAESLEVYIDSSDGDDVVLKFSGLVAGVNSYLEIPLWGELLRFEAHYSSGIQKELEGYSEVLFKSFFNKRFSRYVDVGLGFGYRMVQFPRLENNNLVENLDPLTETMLLADLKISFPPLLNKNLLFYAKTNLAYYFKY
jgi:hypothetical protein